MNYKVHDVKVAKAKGLVPLSEWMFDTEENREILDRMYQQVMKNNGREAMIVYSESKCRLAIFVNNIVKKNSYKKQKICLKQN